jgi:hypothetical protein
MVLKSPLEPLGSPAGGVIPGVAHANALSRARGTRCWGRARSRRPRIPGRGLKRVGPPPGRMLGFASLN